MIEKLISLSLRNRVIVLLLAAGLFAWGLYSVQTNKIDAIPTFPKTRSSSLPSGWAAARRSSRTR
jgi:Cu/Ag efflux pump CusA